LTLLRPSPVFRVAYWCELDECTPCAGQQDRRENWLHGKIFGNLLRMHESLLATARSLIEKYLALPSSIRSKLVTPMERLRKALASNETDMAIDLGIATESLLLSGAGSKEQIALLFRLRGAWLLGRTFETRQEYYEIFKRLYDCRSEAAHSGCVPQHIKL